MKLLYHLLFPPKCILCGEILEYADTDLCAQCRKTVSPYQNRKIHIPFIDSFTALWYYDGSIRRSLLRYKFYRVRSLGPAFGRLLGERVRQEYPDGFDILAWVPVSPLRKLVRGYDQSQIIAQALGSALGRNPTPLLKKIRHNPPQSGITGSAQRRANVLGVYRIAENADVAGKRILLLDDVLTTGATVGECARILKIAGAKQVHCAAVAAARK